MDLKSMTLEQLRARLKEIATALSAIAEAEKSGELTDEQIAQFDALDDEGKKIEAELAERAAAADRAARVTAIQERLATPRPSVGERQLTSPIQSPTPTRRVPGAPAAQQFESPQEAWMAYMAHICSAGRDTDQRLASLHAQRGKIGGFMLPGLGPEHAFSPGIDMAAAQSMGVGSEGGFAVPTQFRPGLAGRVPVSLPVMRGIALVIPAGDPPDAAVTMPALDQSSSIHGGVSVVWFGEGATLTETSAGLRPITLEPQQMGGFITVTDKLLNNWAAAAQLLPGLLRSALNSEEDLRFIQGDGVAKPLGFNGHASSIAVTRNTGGAIKYEDLVLMETRMVAGGMPVWLTSRRFTNQLRLLQSPEGHLIWGDGDANKGIPPTLLGYPVLYAPRVGALGAVGDITLIDGRYYAIKDGSAPIVASSEHVNFTSNKTVIKVVASVDGQPLLNGQVTDEDSNAYSPFVQIAA